MREIRRLVFIFLLFSMSTASETLDRIKGFMPTVTESATLANVVNVYMKIGDWFRATNAVVKGMRNAINDVRSARQAVEDIISAAQEMKKFNFYDMDSWAQTVDNAKLIVGPYTSKILREMGDFTSHTIDGVKDYIGAMESIEDFDIRDEKNKKRRLVAQEFSPESDESYFGETFFIDGVDKYALLKQQKALLEEERKDLSIRISSALPLQKEKLQDSLANVEMVLHRVEKKIKIKEGIAAGILYADKMDSIISDAKGLMASNLVQVEVIHQMVEKIDEQAAEVMESIRRLAENKISGSGQEVNLDEYASMTGDIFGVKDGQGNSIYGSHPNQAPVPESSGNSTSYSFGEMDKAEVNTQDVIQTRNQINLILLRQEKYLRDIEAMKANSMAYLVLIDGGNKSGNMANMEAMKLFATYYSRKAEAK